MTEEPTPGKLKMSTAAPGRKVVAGAGGAALVTVFVVVLNTFVLPPDKLLTPGITGALATVASFTLGYLVRPGARDVVVPD